MKRYAAWGHDGDFRFKWLRDLWVWWNRRKSRANSLRNKPEVDLMNYRTKPVKEATTEQLLFEIIQRTGTGQAPRTITLSKDWVGAEVGIGKDRSATILLSDDDKQALDDLIAETSQ